MSEKKEIVCPRCVGTKVFKSYLHVNQGICFRCKGEGKVLATEYEIKKIQERLA